MTAWADRRIGRLIAGARPDTPADVADRLRRAEANRIGNAEARERFPAITPENFDEAIAYQEQRIAFHLRALEVGR